MFSFFCCYPNVCEYRVSPFTGIIQVFTVTAAGCYMAAFPVPVHILAAAQQLLLIPLHLGGSLLRDRQPRQPAGQNYDWHIRDYQIFVSILHGGVIPNQLSA